MHRNADVPFFGTASDGAIYPFIEASIVQQPGVLFFKVGMRIGIARFNFDDFEISATEQLIRRHVTSGSWSHTSSLTSVSGCSEGLSLQLEPHLRQERPPQ